MVKLTIQGWNDVLSKKLKKRMKLIIGIVLLISTVSFGQIANRLGFDWGFQGPDLAIQLRSRVKITNNFELNLGG